jgi:hypothetical protein
VSDGQNFNNVDTTDVQRAEAVFFENRLFLRCSFAANSQARGCAVILTLSGRNDTERFELDATSGGNSSLCTEANNQREAYSSVKALDIEANGSDGVVRLDIAPAVLETEGEYVAMTGCRQPSKLPALLIMHELRNIILTVWLNFHCVYVY